MVESVSFVFTVIDGKRNNEGYIDCRNGHEIGDTYVCEYGCPTDFCQKCMLKPFPLWKPFAEKFQTVTWNKNSEYLYHAKLVGYFHIYIMKKWYGEETYEQLQNLQQFKRKEIDRYLDIAEVRALAHEPMYMKDWLVTIDDYLKMTRRDISTTKGRVTHKQAIDKAHAEYEKYRKKQDELLSPVCAVVF